MMVERNNLKKSSPASIAQWKEPQPSKLFIQVRFLVGVLMQFLKKESVFLNDWSDKDGVARDFETDLKDTNVLFASYSCADYSGDAFVLFEKDGKLYEVNGGHCSCYGLEGQWAPEETAVDAIMYRLYDGKMGQDSWSDNVYSEALKSYLGDGS